MSVGALNDFNEIINNKIMPNNHNNNLYVQKSLGFYPKQNAKVGGTKCMSAKKFTSSK